MGRAARLFHTYFGMLIFVEEKFYEAQTLEIWETEEEKNLSIHDLKNRLFEWALSKFRGKDFYNKSINQKIHVSRAGLGKWKTETKSHDQAASIKILDSILKEASYWKEAPALSARSRYHKVYLP